MRSEERLALGRSVDNYQRKGRMHQHKCRWVARYVEKLLKFSSGYFSVLTHLLSYRSELS